MSDDPLYIDGKLVTEGNARRFVQARRPHAEAHRENGGSYMRRVVCSVVRDRTPGAPIWCNASGKTAGEAWLRVARQMVARDTLEAANRQAMARVARDLHSADTPSKQEPAALRYAAERLHQSKKLYGDAQRQAVAALLEMASEGEGT